MKRLIVTGAFLLGAGLQSCDTNRVVDQYLPVDGQEWFYADVKVVEVPIVDTVASYKLFINLRHGGNYEWQNLYLRMHIASPSGDTATQMVSVPLADAAGRWLGSGLGDIVELQWPYKEQIKFLEQGTYVFRLEQHMRLNPLRAVYDVGLRVEKQ
jgi:gliding motility-associated lipoprotein GldH